MRLQTQLLLRVARQLAGPSRDQLVAGLTRIDEGIATLVRQIDQDTPS